MKLSIHPKYLLITTIFLALGSTGSILFGAGWMYINSEKSNVYAQGDRFVSGLTSSYGIHGSQDLKTDRERSLNQTIVWMNERCATNIKLAYMFGHWVRNFGIYLVFLTVCNIVVWWYWRKDWQNKVPEDTARKLADPQKGVL